MVGTLSREMSNHEEEELEQPGTLLELQETSNARFTGIEKQIAQLAGLVQRLIPGGSDSARDSPQARVNAGGGLDGFNKNRVICLQDSLSLKRRSQVISYPSRG